MDVSASNPSACAPLSLPSPEAGSSVSDPDSKKLNADGPLQSIKLDELGPMIVNNDGVGLFFAFFAYHHWGTLCLYYSIHVIFACRRCLESQTGRKWRTRNAKGPFQKEQVNANIFSKKCIGRN